MKRYQTIIGWAAVLVIVAVFYALAAITPTNEYPPSNGPAAISGCTLFAGATHSQDGTTSDYCLLPGRNQFIMTVHTAGDTVAVTPQIWSGGTWRSIGETVTTTAGDTNYIEAYPLLVAPRFRVRLSDCESCTVNVRVDALAR